MKHLLITTIAAVVLVGCGESQPPEPSTAKAPDVSIREAVKTGNIQAVKQYLNASGDVNAKGEDGRTPLHGAVIGRQKEIVELLLAEGADVNAKDVDVTTPLDLANLFNQPETADLLRKHGGKTGEELKAEGK